MKFVVDRLDDCYEVEAYLAELPELDRGASAADAARRRLGGIKAPRRVARTLLSRSRLALLPATTHRVVRIARGT